jgi:uncharacterized protein
MAQPGPVSPCINICALDEQGYCLGCYRTIDEIAGWTRLSSEEQWAVMGQLAARQARIERRDNAGAT